MEKDRGTKMIAIIALLIAVAGVSLGFAAFSNVLTISPSANVTPNSDTFNVDFSSSDTSLETDPIVPAKNPDSITATNATIDNSTAPTITGLDATFTEPGQSVTYTFYATNTGEYDAFLKSIVYANVSEEQSTKVCKAIGDTTDALVQQACSSISVNVKVGSEAETSGSVATITGHRLAKDAYEMITVRIEYDSNGTRADGDFSVEFGDISLNYSSVD